MAMSLVGFGVLSILLCMLCGLWASANAIVFNDNTIPYNPLPDLFDITIDDIVVGFAAKQFTSVDLVKAYIARIAEVQEVLRPVIEINPEAIAIAQALDNERLSMNKTRGPMHGVPVLLKDNIGTADQLNTTAGSYALYGSIVPRDSTVAANLRAAGCVILGKAGLSEWAFWRGVNNSNGWSARGGQVKGAYYFDQDPSGSSSGSAVAASIGLSAITIGTDTGGSIIAPSTQNGVVGIRPSTGLTSRSVVVPITAVQDSIGPICRSVKDAAYTLSAMAGPKGDPYDNYTNAIPFDQIPDYASFCKLDGLQGARLGIPRNIFTAPVNRTERDIQQIAAFDAVLPVLKELGANITDNADYPNITA
jgi:amidase